MSAKNADIPIAVLKVRRTFVRLCLENDDSHPNLKVLGDFDVGLHFVWFICFRVFIEQEYFCNTYVKKIEKSQQNLPK